MMINSLNLKYAIYQAFVYTIQILEYTSIYINNITVLVQTVYLLMGDFIHPYKYFLREYIQKL